MDKIVRRTANVTGTLSRNVIAGSATLPKRVRKRVSPSFPLTLGAQLIIPDGYRCGSSITFSVPHLSICTPFF